MCGRNKRHFRDARIWDMVAAMAENDIAAGGFQSSYNGKVITEEEAKNHPKKNVLMKALGSNETLEADIFETSPDVDGVLLCSDGLTNMLTKEQIEHTLNSSDTIENKVKMLIRKCNSRGGTDNISVAFIDLKSGCEK